jgi:4-hydroxysphinganine ceramide fatty acyl 2-hydroxylase
LVFLFHENHHINPNDWYRGLMPLAPAFLYGVLVWFFLYLILGFNYALPFMSGLVTGYITYDYLHFSFHHWHFNISWWKKLRDNHLRHHVSPNMIYGVSSPLWDKIFDSEKK